MRICTIVGVFAAAVLWTPAHCLAQGAALADARQYFASRRALEVRAREAEAAATSPSTPSAVREQMRAAAGVIRQRLALGDFNPGDQIVVEAAGQPTIRDTVRVLAGRTIRFGGLPAISLEGVLRSELHDHLTKEIGLYVREPRVETTSLIRLLLTGQVVHPGFYTVPADVLLSELIMRAGGPSGDANISKVSIRRNGKEIWMPGTLSKAFSDGMSLDQLDFRGGEEILVPQQRRTDWSRVVTILGSTVGALSLIAAASSR